MSVSFPMLRSAIYMCFSDPLSRLSEIVMLQLRFPPLLSLLHMCRDSRDKKRMSPSGVSVFVLVGTCRYFYVYM